ncbi:MAG TPA: hypothetical protein VG816_00455 [Solirubrobacterales bacterium]|nr:hypothetical protein [Solirubrobacterales bacterium]
MRDFLAALLVACLASLALTGAAQADPSEYGIESASASATSNLAGAHADFTVAFAFKTEKGGALPATTKDVSVELPAGLLANPSAAPKCSAAQLVGTDPEDKSNETGCPQDSQIGITEVLLTKGPGNNSAFTEPVYNMESPGGDTVARLGFIADVYPVFIDAHIRSEGDYGATITIEGAGSLIPLLSATTTTWGVPADKSHDGERITPYEAVHNGGAPETPSGKRPSGLVPKPFMVNPTRCGVPRQVRIVATSYALPAQPSVATASLPPVSGCGALDFSPAISFTPTTREAESPSGVDFKLSLPQQGLSNPLLSTEAHLKSATVTLPQGLSLNPAAAAGLGACSEAEVGLVSASPQRFADDSPGCPESSRVGNLEIQTPLLPEPIGGSLYLATPVANPFGTLLAGYLVAHGQGVTIKLAGRIDIDPVTHRIVARFDEGPQAPFETARLRFKSGARGVLTTPPTCGRHDVLSALSPWSAADPDNPAPDEIAQPSAPFAIDSGPAGAPCPVPGFAPSFEAWASNPRAGHFSPLVTRFARPDGSQRFGQLTVTMPRGVTGRLAGIPYCPEAALAAAGARGGIGQGAIELSAPSCPAASQVGEAIAGAGSGPSPFFVPAGKVYLAGPYRGAPLSLAIVTPALAGPFDLGVVVVRAALFVDPESAQVSVVADPLPSALQGIPLDIRDVRVVTAPGFALNPTDCRATRVGATLVSELGASASASTPFQVGGCRHLGLAPKLSLSLSGKTNRGAHPRLRAVLRPRPGDANLSSVQVTLPRSEFLEQAHIRTICTRVQFAAHNCPAASVYGHAQVTTPLLDEPLRGPVYLRSSSHELPDLAIDLRGQVPFVLDGRIDSIDGGIRTTFAATPDAPFTKAVLTMQGGKKGLLVNSRDLCAGDSRAKVAFSGQNGRRSGQRPLLRNDCADRRSRREGS